MIPITNDAVIFGLLSLLLGLVFYTSNLNSKGWKLFYSICPALFVCYFLPSLFVSLGLVNVDESKLYFVVSRYLLPASLILLTLNIDFKELSRLGSKALIVFLTGSLGIIIGGPITLWIVMQLFPGSLSEVAGEETWRGMTTIAGAWIGGGANQTAMKEVFDVSDKVFSGMVTVDILVSNVLLALLLAGAQRSHVIDKWFKADASAIEEVKNNIENYVAQIARVTSLKDFAAILAVGFAGVGLSHFLSDAIVPWITTDFPALEKYSLTSSFFWIVVISTTIGMILSTTKVRSLEGAGASKIGSLFIYLLVATIGLKMNVLSLSDNPVLILIGVIWVFIHIGLMILVAKMVKAPFFFVAVGSQANIGGAASAPVVAASFHPALAPVGVLLAVLGYALGTYGAYLCGLMMQWVAL